MQHRAWARQDPSERAQEGDGDEQPWDAPLLRLRVFAVPSADVLLWQLSALEQQLESPEGRCPLFIPGHQSSAKQRQLTLLHMLLACRSLCRPRAKELEADCNRLFGNCVFTHHWRRLACGTRLARLSRASAPAPGEKVQRLRARHQPYYFRCGCYSNEIANVSHEWAFVSRTFTDSVYGRHAALVGLWLRLLF